METINVTVTKRFEFCYGHHLPEYSGKCCVQHGHNAILDIEVSGAPFNLVEPYAGMTCDFGTLKKIVTERVLDILDHQNLNDLPAPDYGPTDEGFTEEESVFFVMASVPTAENTVRWIVATLYETFGMNLHRVRLYETPDSYAEWCRV